MLCSISLSLDRKPKMKVKIQLKETVGRSETRHMSVAHDRLQFKVTSKVCKQIQEAVDFCLENGCKGYAALATGKFPLIKDARTINRRLNPTDPRHLTTGEEKSYCKILTKEEESSFVRYLMNKNRYVQKDFVCGTINKTY